MSGLKDQLIESLERIPGLEHRLWPERVDDFSTLHYDGKEVGHFHNSNELDLRLGKKLIRVEGLHHHPDSNYHPNRTVGSQYIELRFCKISDLADIVRLVQLAVDGLAK